MADTTAANLSSIAPLTALTEEERMFQAAAREFAEKEIRPHVEDMDREGVFNHQLIGKFFEQGFMGLEVPEAYGGSGGTFFMAILAIEEFSRVDASAGVVIDVQNTLVNNALQRWGSEAQKQKFLPRLVNDVLGAYALSEPNSGSDAFSLTARARAGRRPLHPERPQALDHKRHGSRFVHCVRDRQSPTRLQGHHGVPDRARYARLQRGQEGGQAGNSCLLHV